MQSRLGGLATGIYDDAYIGTSYAGRAQTDFLRFVALREGAHGAALDGAARKLLDAVVDNLGVTAGRIRRGA